MQHLKVFGYVCKIIQINKTVYLVDNINLKG